MEKIKTISVLLDLSRTTDYIDNEKTIIFLNQLETLRQKFEADIATICISTHYDNTNKMKQVINTIAFNLYNTCHLSDTIQIGTSFYLDGTYDYKNDKEERKEINFNGSKIDTFHEYYLNSEEFDNQWFAIIDDGVSDDVYKKYKDTHLMLQCRPSSVETWVARNNFMRIDTTTSDFDGVIEILDKYTESIKDLDNQQILEKQKNILDYKDELEIIIKYLDSGEIISSGELMSIKHRLNEILEEAMENNDGKNIYQIKYLQKRIVIN